MGWCLSERTHPHRCVHLAGEALCTQCWWWQWLARTLTTCSITCHRFSLLTGRYASNASSIVARRPWSIVGFNTFLTGAEPTIAHALRPLGYRTGFVGKYHLGFPLPPSQRRGRASFGGSGRGLSYDQLADAVRRHGGFDEAAAVWGGNRQTAKSPHHPEWMAAEACAFVRRAVGAGRRFFLYFAPTLPHAPFSLPDSLLANVSITPAGILAGQDVKEWEASRRALLGRLTSLGLVCRDYSECSTLRYAGAEGRSSIAYREPINLADPWISRQRIPLARGSRSPEDPAR